MCRVAAGVGLLGVLIAAAAVRAEPADGQAQMQARIDAGEFAPALAEARRAEPAQRDFWLAQIAEAQAQVGARDAWMQTASEISDDQVRAKVVAGDAPAPAGGRGGAAMADFDSLIDLITSTIKPTSWDAAGGPGSIQQFPTGVYVDADGVLQPLLKRDRDGRLAEFRARHAPRARQENVRRPSRLRMVSLTRLEKQVQLGLALGREPTEDMQLLAGLQRIEYVLVFPETGDLVLAGPAGDWTVGPEDLIVGKDTGRPVVRLDDLVVILRHMTAAPDARFGCAINPRQEGLARLQEFLHRSSQRPVLSEFRDSWVRRLRATLGPQDVEVHGIDPRTRAARVIVEADYRMKLVGMGLEAGVPGVDSYLRLIRVPRGGTPPPMGVLRWWFTLNYDAVLASQDRLAFALRGQGVKVESENERLTAQGQRVHTGQSEALNRQFAQSFTEHFSELCEKYPIYAELRNLFDLALVGALVRREGLAQKTGWHMTCFGAPGSFPVALGAAPKAVDSVVNYRVINGVNIVAGVSGGVAVDPNSLVSPQSIRLDDTQTLEKRHETAAAKELPWDGWWWD
jgi:hypothetical protein